MWSSLFMFLLLMQQLILNNVVSYPSQEKSRVKRIANGTPKPRPSPDELTSEEIREMESGTESPHIFDYPESIYKNNEVRKGEWSHNPIPRKKLKNVTEVVKAPPPPPPTLHAPAKRVKGPPHPPRQRPQPQQQQQQQNFLSFVPALFNL